VKPKSTPKQRRFFLSEFLEVPETLVFDSPTKLSDFGMERLMEFVDLGLYKPTHDFGVPEVGQFFLELDSLRNGRVTIYRATGKLRECNIILQAPFNFKECKLQDSMAEHKGQVVEVLSSSADNNDMVVILKKGLLILVNISDLSNLKQKPRHKLTMKNRLKWLP
jgi:hypothetical protein